MLPAELVLSVDELQLLAAGESSGADGDVLSASVLDGLLPSVSVLDGLLPLPPPPVRSAARTAARSDALGVHWLSTSDAASKPTLSSKTAS